jgi:hypothetical protein
MHMTSILASAPLAIVAIVVVLVAAILLISRALLAVALAVFVAVCLWDLDLFPLIEKVRHLATIPTDHMRVAEFGLGLACGLVIFSALFFSRGFAQAVLAGAAIAILYLIATGGVPALMRMAALLLQLVQEFDSFGKGVAVGKLVTSFFKFRQLRRRAKLRVMRSPHPCRKRLSR